MRAAICLWLIGAGMAGASYAQGASEADLARCAKSRDVYLSGTPKSATVAQAMQDTADRKYDLCVKSAERDARMRAESQETRNKAAELARRKREELRAEMDRCMPRGDCNEEYLRTLSEQAVEHEYDARYGR
ncbi:hypothetical protein R6138_04192 [Ralstonia thomasii]|nr:hypothetical protein R6138_04192 [Ralstonia sp. LMG 18095]